MVQSHLRFAILVVLGLLALGEVELWRRRPVFVADATGGAYLVSERQGRTLYCERGDCQPVKRMKP